MQFKTLAPRRARRVVVCAVAGILPTLIHHESANAATRSWIGNSGSWSVTSNWQNGILPGNGDAAVAVFNDLQNYRTITLNVSPTGVLSLVQISGGSSPLAGATILNISSTFLAANEEQIGINGVGAVNQSGGTNQLQPPTNGSSTLYLGYNASGRGNYNFSGGNLSATQAYLGYNGNGTLTQSSGLANFSGITMGYNAGSNGTYILSNDAYLSMSAGAYFTIGGSGNGTFAQSGGQMNTSHLWLGQSLNSAGIYNLSGGSAYVGNAASFSDSNMIVGYMGTGVVNHSGGTLSVDSPNVGQPGLVIGYNGVGTYNLSGTGFINSSSRTYVGNGAMGHFFQNGGTNSSANLYVGFSAAGEYIINSGAAIVGNVLTVSNGTFTQNGGSVSVGSIFNLQVPDQTGQLSMTGVYNLKGGTLSTYGIELVANFGGGTGGVFTQAGGVHNVTGIFDVGDIGGLAPGATGLYTLSNGTLNVQPALVSFFGAGTDGSMDGFRLDNGGTLAASAPASFTGKLTLKGGVITGTLNSYGAIAGNSGTIAGVLINHGTVTMNNGTIAAQQTIQNLQNAFVNGAGTILGGMINRGQISPDGALAISSITNTDAGRIDINYATSLRPIFIDNFSQIHLNGGALLGSGQVYLEANSANGGGMLSGGGMVETELVLNGGILRADNPAIPLTINSIDIEDGSSQIIVAPNSTMVLQNPLINGVDFSLQGAGARLVNATITNQSTLRGAGEITGQVVNNGLIRAEGGLLTLSNPNNSNFSGQIQAGANTVRFTKGLQINGGVMSMSGGEFDLSTGSINNIGTILGRGTWRSGTLTNNGTVLLSAGVTDLFAPVTNNGRFNITGNAVATFYSPVTTSTGTINVNLSSSAVFLAPVTGVAHITGAGVKDFESTASLGAIATSLGTTLVGPTGNLTTDYVRDGTLNVVGKAKINASGSSNAVSRVNSLIIDGSPGNWAGELDLADNDMIVDYTGASPITTIKDQLRSGYANGAWTGKGIRSSSTGANLALGFGESSALNLSSFDGQSIDSTAILIKFTYAGDANLDGKVDISDLYQLVSNYNTTGKLWTAGDYNYDGNVNIQDYNLLAHNWQAGVASPLGMSLGAALNVLQTAIPEPSSVGLLCIGALTFGRRRRRGVH